MQRYKVSSTPNWNRTQYVNKMLIETLFRISNASICWKKKQHNRFHWIIIYLKKKSTHTKRFETESWFTGRIRIPPESSSRAVISPRIIYLIFKFILYISIRNDRIGIINLGFLMSEKWFSRDRRRIAPSNQPTGLMQKQSFNTIDRPPTFALSTRQSLNQHRIGPTRPPTNPVVG